MVYRVALSRSLNGRDLRRLGDDYILDSELTTGRGNNNRIQIPDGRVDYRHGRIYLPGPLTVHYSDSSQIGAGLFTVDGRRIRFIDPRDDIELHWREFIALAGTGCYYRLELSD